MFDSTNPIHAAFAAHLERVRGKVTPDGFDHLIEDVVATAHRLNAIDAHRLGTSKPSTIHTTDKDVIA